MKYRVVEHGLLKEDGSMLEGIDLEWEVENRGARDLAVFWALNREPTTITINPDASVRCEDGLEPVIEDGILKTFRIVEAK